MYVMIVLSGGLIDDVRFFEDEQAALGDLFEYARSMEPDDNDAAVYGPEGMILNAKTILEDNTMAIDMNGHIRDQKDGAILIIGNPHHRLGFMVVSTDDPLGFDDPAEAVFELCQLRKMFGSHLKLYEVFPMERPLVERAALERRTIDCCDDNFDYGEVIEYLKPDGRE